VTRGPDDLDDPGVDPATVAAAAAATLRERSGVERHDVAVVLGSGWAAAADLLGTVVAEVPAVDVPGFAAPTVAGHVGTIRSVRVPGSGLRVLVLGSRTHLYEGRGVRRVVHGVRTAAAAGAQVLLLTNGSGGLDPAWGPGTPVLVADHLNLSGTTPLEGPRFVDLTALYSPRLRALARAVDPTLAEGVYVQRRGPEYETPAEIAMLARLGGHLVGMSTAVEAIAAREAGLEVLGVSLVTNHAAGISAGPISHAEVLAAGAAAGPRIGALLAEVLRRLPAGR
jgi:purine-nucleoside phosphorylase